MPFPLYGSGGRNARISAATWPTCCLSMPSTWIRVLPSSVNAMPFGGLAGAETDALNLEALTEALRDAFEHVGDERAREAVRGAMRLVVAEALDAHGAVFDRDAHDRQDALFERSLRTFDAHERILDFDVDAAGDRNGEFTDSRHRRLPYQT